MYIMKGIFTQIEIPEIKCKFCGEVMQEYAESFVCCYNEDCLYKRLPIEKKLPHIPGAYYLQWEKQ